MSFLSVSSPFTPFLRNRLHYAARVGVQRKIALINSSDQVRLKNSSSDHDSSQRTSVTGMIYEENSKDSPVVQLYTKEGCTLCDKAKDILQSVREENPHSLEAIDITDPDKQEVFDMYKWDIPVLHIDGLYWTKHRLTAEEAEKALSDAREGIFEAQTGQPNAAEMERKMAERKANS